MNTQRVRLSARIMLAFAWCCFTAGLPVAQAEDPVKKTRPSPAAGETKATAEPKFQYKSAGIEVPAATADEPKVKAFGVDSIRLARKYLDDGARHWVRERRCIACHSTGVYMVERSALTPQLGKPSEEVLANFIKSIPKPEAKKDSKP